MRRLYPTPDQLDDIGRHLGRFLRLTGPNAPPGDAEEFWMDDHKAEAIRVLRSTVQSIDRAYEILLVGPEGCPDEELTPHKGLVVAGYPSEAVLNSAIEGVLTKLSAMLGRLGLPPVGLIGDVLLPEPPPRLVVSADEHAALLWCLRTIHGALKWAGCRVPRPSPKSESIPALVLGKFGERPVIFGKPTESLTRGRYKIIKALWDAGPDGLSLTQLMGHEASDMSRPDIALRDLLRDFPEWRRVVARAGGSNKRYRLKACVFLGLEN